MTVVFGVIEMDAAESIGVVLVRGGRREHDGVIGAHAGTGVDGVGVAAAKQNASFGASDEKGAGAVEPVQAQEVHVGAIHYVEPVPFAGIFASEPITE